MNIITTIVKITNFVDESLLKIEIISDKKKINIEKRIVKTTANKQVRKIGKTNNTHIAPWQYGH